MDNWFGIIQQLMKKVVVIGGGTGTFVTLSALKAIPDLDLSAIVSVADSGGSTGRLRDEFGFLPVGDLRQALAALAKKNGRDGESQSWIRDLLLYRFSKGSGLEGHNLGNLILTALQDMTGSTALAVEIASKVFKLHGHIYPIITKNIQLVVEYQDGTVEIGESILDDVTKHKRDRIVSLKTSPKATIYSKAKEAIEEADVIIIGPGDLYGSILPNLVIDGVDQAFRVTKANVVLTMNLMTRCTQTYGMTAKDHLWTVEKYLKRKVNIVIMNDEQIPGKLLKAYQKQDEFPIEDDLDDLDSYEIIRAALVRETEVRRQKGDSLNRSYLRHDSVKLSKILKRIIN